MLRIYLNDHLAGSTVGRELARRAARANQSSPAYGPFLAELATEIDEDRESLLALMRGLGASIDHVKVIGGWGAEKLGRLKLNGQLFGYSPLSRVVELEGLTLGVTGKRGLWRALIRIAPQTPGLDEAELRRLEQRADDQLERLETHRLRAVAEALPGAA